MNGLHIAPLTLETQGGARALIRHVWREHFGEHPDPLVREYMDDERVMEAVSPSYYAAQNGLFLVACDMDTVVGCGGVRQMPDGRYEFQRLYVAATHRRLGIAGRILSACTSFAREQDGHTLCLSSNKALTTSHQFYRQLGFEPTAAWDPKIEPYAYFFQRPL